jgi:peptidoglycan/LPS O-acetylase OafA/YrhL
MSISPATASATATAEPTHKLDYVAAARTEKLRFAGIDGLRGIACLLVLWMHSWLAFGQQKWPGLGIGSHRLSLARIFERGYGGVDLFFVLSGFCLSFPILSKPLRAVRWDRYFIARVRRIVPPYWAALFLFGAMSLLVERYKLHAYFGGDLHWPGIRAFVVQGLFFWKRILAGPFWTLVIEWRWYFLFPLCIWLCRRAGAWGLLLASILASALSMTLKYRFDMNWTVSWAEGLFRYLPLFAFGILAAEFAAGIRKQPWEQFILRNSRWGLLLSIAVVIWLPLADNDSWQFTVQRMATWGPLAFFATIASVRDPQVERILSWKPLVRVGIFSYSLYLLHEPLVSGIGTYVAGAAGPMHVTSRIAIFAFSVAIAPLAAIAFSYLFFLVFERPFLSRRKSASATEVAQFARLREAAVP